MVMLLPVDISTVSTHSRAKAAAVHQPGLYIPDGVSTHSRAKAAAPHYDVDVMGVFVFQHTAARRRLLSFDPIYQAISEVSTHSRAEAAAQTQYLQEMMIRVSTHSRAEAAAFLRREGVFSYHCFNTQPRGGGCPI